MSSWRDIILYSLEYNFSRNQEQKILYDLEYSKLQRNKNQPRESAGRPSSLI